MSDPLGFLRGIHAALPDSPRSLAFSPDGSKIAVGTERVTYAVDAQTGAVEQLGKCGGVVAWGPIGVIAVDYGRTKRFLAGAKRNSQPSGRALAIRRSDDGMEVLGDDGSVLARLPVSSWSGAVAGHTAAIHGRDGVEMFDVSSGVTRLLTLATPSASSVALSPDGSRVLVSGGSGSWEGPRAGPWVWVPNRGALAHAGSLFAIGGALFRIGELTPFIDAGHAEHIALSPTGDRVCIASGRMLQIIALADLAQGPPIVGPKKRVHAIAVSESHGRLAACDEGGLVCVRRLDDSSLVSTFRVDGREAPLAWAEDGTLFVGGAGIEVWDVEAGRRCAGVPLPELGSVEGLRLRGDRIYARGHHLVSILDESLRTLTTLGPWPGKSDTSDLVAFDVSADGETVWVGRRDQSTLAITLGDRTERELPEASCIVAGADFTALSGWSEAVLVKIDGASRPTNPFTAAVAISGALASAGNDRFSIEEWSGPRLEMQFRNGISVLAATTAPPRLYTGGTTTWIAERRLEDGQLRRVFASGGGGKVTALAFDPSGDRLAVGEMSGRLHVWGVGADPRRIGLLDATTLQPPGTIREPGRLGTIEDLAFPGGLYACESALLVWEGDLGAIGTTEPRMFGEGPTRVSRDGKRFVRGAQWGADTVFFDATGELWRRPGSDSGDRFIDISDDGELVLVGTAGDEASDLIVYDASGDRRGHLRVEGKVRCMKLSSQGDVLGWTRDKGPFFRWRVASGIVERWCDPPVPEEWRPEEMVRGGKKVALVGDVISILDEETGLVLAVVPSFPRYGATAAALSADGRRLAFGGWHGEVRIYAIDGASPRCLAELMTTEDGGWWSAGEQFTHVPGEAATKLWSEP